MSILYTIFSANPNLLTIVKMKDNSIKIKKIGLVKSSLIEYVGIDEMMNAENLVCVGAYGALVMQGHKNGLVTKLKEFFAP